MVGKAILCHDHRVRVVILIWWIQTRKGFKLSPSSNINDNNTDNNNDIDNNDKVDNSTDNNIDDDNDAYSSALPCVAVPYIPLCTPLFSSHFSFLLF